MEKHSISKSYSVRNVQCIRRIAYELAEIGGGGSDTDLDGAVLACASPIRSIDDVSIAVHSSGHWKDILWGRSIRRTVCGQKVS